MRKFFATLIASLFLFASGEAYAPEGEVYVTMLDVGQGESILVETLEQNILIDTGYTGESDKLRAELEKAGVTRFERIILTHPHVDHIGGIGYILDNYEVDEISDNGIASASTLYQRYRSADGVKALLHAIAIGIGINDIPILLCQRIADDQMLIETCGEDIADTHDPKQDNCGNDRWKRNV